MRHIGLDLGRERGEAALVDETGRAIALGRLEVNHTALEAFARTLRPDDQVALEASTNSFAIAELLTPHVGRVVVSNPLRTKAIASAKVKSDAIDARTLAQLLAADYLPEVWQPDPATQALRRLVGLRAGLVRQRTGLRNRVAAIVARHLEHCPVSDPFGVRGRAWLAGLSDDERLALEIALRLHDAVETEVSAVEQAIAAAVRDDRGVRHGLSVPGLGLVNASALCAVIGDVRRFPRPAQLVGYLGLDPRVRQSGARSFIGHISRAGQAHVRGLLIEAAHAAVRTPGPLRAFYLRVRGRRGTGVAIVAVARKLAVLSWHLLTKDEDYRWAPGLRTAEKLRRLERLAGDPKRPSRRGGAQGGPATAAARWRAERERERAVLVQAEAAYIELVRSRRPRRDAAAASGERLNGPAEPEPAAPRS
jgi:transposase